MSKPQPTSWELLKAILLPIDSSTFGESISYLKGRHSEIDWLKFCHRLEGVSVLILLSGFVVWLIVFLIEGKADLSWMKSLGIPYILGFIFLLVYSIARVIIKIVDSINLGESILGGSSKESSVFLAMKLALGILFLFVPTYIVWVLDISLVETAVMFVLSFFVVGSLIAGISSVISFIILIWSNPLG